MEILEEKKLDVVMAQLQERYEASHKMRDRSMQFVLWILGFGLGMMWLLINETQLTCLQQITVTGLLVLLCAATLWFNHAIHRGFENNHKIEIKLETILKLYEKNYYGITESILPPSYSETKKKSTGHFETLFMIIVVIFVSAIILTWANPYSHTTTRLFDKEPPKQIETITDN